jgi:hypothetical protein
VIRHPYTHQTIFPDDPVRKPVASRKKHSHGARPAGVHHYPGCPRHSACEPTGAFRLINHDQEGTGRLALYYTEVSDGGSIEGIDPDAVLGLCRIGDETAFPERVGSLEQAVIITVE